MPKPPAPRSESAVTESSSGWARWEFFLLLIPLLVFGFLATYNIHRPGLYNDEMFVISPAFGVRTYKTWFGLPILISPYCGANKSWIYPLIFSLFGVSAWSIRFPSVLMSCGTLVLGYSLVRRILTPRWALAFTAACAVHPAFIFLTKVDWGPQVFMLFLKALCLVLCFKWLDGVARSCWAVLGLWVLGFWDKFNFVWFIIALVIATCVIYRGFILERLRRVRPPIVLSVGFGLLVAGLLTLWIIFPLLEKPQTTVFSSRLLQIWTLYQYTCTGFATAAMWFKSVPPMPTWTGWIVPTLTIAFLVVSLVVVKGKTASNNIDRRRLRFCLWCLLMFAIIFVEIAVTRQAGGAHHTIMLFPFDLLACFGAAYLLANALSGKSRRLILVVQGCVLCLWITSNLESLEAHFSKFKDKDSFYGRFSPRIEALAKYLNKKGRSVDAIYCVEWGLGNQLGALCEPAIARRIRDEWQTFQYWSADKAEAQAATAAIFRQQEKALFVSFTKQDPVYLPAQNHFAEMNVLAGNRTEPVSNLPADLATTYQVFQSYGR